MGPFIQTKGIRMNLQDFRALANPSTGLVAMTMIRSFAPWRRNETAGFPPETALDHFNNGVAKLYGDPSPGENMPAARREPTREPAKESKAAAGPEIPDDFETEMHPLQRIKLAKVIDPDHKVEGDEKPTEAADRVIREELARRKA